MSSGAESSTRPAAATMTACIWSMAATRSSVRGGAAVTVSSASGS